MPATATRPTPRTERNRGRSVSHGRRLRVGQLPPYGQIDGRPAGPNAPQLAFHRLPTKFKGFWGGVGSGKSHAGIREFFDAILDNGPGHLYLVGAPTHAILQDATWPHFTAFLDQFHEVNGWTLDEKRLISPQNRAIVIRGGIKIRFISLDNPSKYAGPTIAGFLIDEADLVPSGAFAWKALTQRLRANAPRLFGIAVSSPRGPVGIAQFFHDRVKEGDPAYGFVRASTRDNPANPPDYLRDMLAGMSEREIQQQIEGHILDFVGAVYSGSFDDVENIWKGYAFDRGNKERDYYLAFDWGPHYPHVLLIEHRRDRDIDIVVDEYCEDHKGHRQVIEEATAQFQARWGLRPADYAAVYCDHNPADARYEAYAFFRRGRSAGARPVISELQRPGDWEHGLSTVAWRLEPNRNARPEQRNMNTRRLFFADRLLQSKSPRSILRCLKLYRWREGVVDSTMVLEDRVTKGPHCNGPDALRYYCGPRYRAERWRDERA